MRWHSQSTKSKPNLTPMEAELFEWKWVDKLNLVPCVEQPLNPPSFLMSEFGGVTSTKLCNFPKMHTYFWQQLVRKDANYAHYTNTHVSVSFKKRFTESLHHFNNNNYHLGSFCHCCTVLLHMNGHVKCAFGSVSHMSFLWNGAHVNEDCFSFKNAVLKRKRRSVDAALGCFYTCLD